jgi:hypothetical protein
MPSLCPISLLEKSKEEGKKGLGGKPLKKPKCIVLKPIIFFCLVRDG